MTHETRRRRQSHLTIHHNQLRTTKQLANNALLSCRLLTAHLLRTALSVLGIAVSIAAVVLMVSVGRGAEKEILDQIRSLGTDLIVIQAPQARAIPGRERQSDIVTTLTQDDATAILSECRSVSLVAPAVSKAMTAHWLDRKDATMVEGMTAEGFEIRNITVARGRKFDHIEDRTRQRVAVVGPSVVETLFNGADPIGQRIDIGTVPFEVIGVTVPRGANAYGSDQDDLILVPLETAMRRLLNISYVHAIYVQARSTEFMKQAEREIREVLDQRQRRTRRESNFMIQNQAELLETEREAARALTLLIGSVAGIALLAGGIGVLAVMLMSVRERTREIGLRRAVGARRRDILIQFLFESALLGALGGFIGVASGIGASYAVAALGLWDALIFWPAAGLGLIVSISVGLIFGIVPALRAARLEPIEALRAA